MIIGVNIQLSEDDVMEETSAEVADSILRAVGGDEDKDFVQVTIQQPSESGYFGTPPTPPLLSEESE